MKKKLFYFLLLAALLFGCKKKTETPIKKTLKLTENQSHTFENVTFTVVDVIDNRCPANANCATPGSVKIILNAQSQIDEANISLCLGDCREIGATDNIIMELANVKYQVALKEITTSSSISQAFTGEVITLEVIRG